MSVVEVETTVEDPFVGVETFTTRCFDWMIETVENDRWCRDNMGVSDKQEPSCALGLIHKAIEHGC